MVAAVVFGAADWPAGLSCHGNGTADCPMGHHSWLGWPVANGPTLPTSGYPLLLDDNCYDYMVSFL